MVRFFDIVPLGVKTTVVQLGTNKRGVCHFLNLLIGGYDIINISKGQAPV